jgi:glucose-6-phosphate dehydrogenase assembly protein OpcA
MTTLWDTTGGEIVAALAAARREHGAVATGLVLTMVAVVPERGAAAAVQAASEAAQAHPCRILALTMRAPDAPAPRLDAEITVGGRYGAAETVQLRMEGRLVLHAESVVLPLLAPDTPVLTWWAGQAPQRTAEDPLGSLASRRVTDAAVSADPPAELAQRARDHHPGDTDLAWTRLTPWRSVLAGSLDTDLAAVSSAEVAAAPGNPSALLLASWLGRRLAVPVALRNSGGPGITEVTLTRADGLLTLRRTDGLSARLQRPGQQERTLPLPRRALADLLAEELRRLGDDEPYAEALAGVPALLAAAESTGD